MAFDYEYSEVYFDKYCKFCAHEKEEGYESKCENCLENNINLYSHRPVKFEKKDMDINEYYEFIKAETEGVDKITEDYICSVCGANGLGMLIRKKLIKDAGISGGKQWYVIK